MATYAHDSFPALTRPAASKSNQELSVRRRRIGSDAGEAIEVLGHAIEYLATNTFRTKGFRSHPTTGDCRRFIS